MNLLNFFKPRPSASVARDRLQILLAHERTFSGKSDLLARLREEIVAAVTKHVAVDKDQVRIKMDGGDAVSTLEIEIEIPTPVERKEAVNA